MILLRKKHRDPNTGDEILRAERISLAVQGVMRRWSFVFAYTAITVAWWLHPVFFGDNAQYTHWQLAASYMALLIESLVGIGMFGWARRDSVILRKIYALERSAEKQDENNLALLHEMLKLAKANEETIKVTQQTADTNERVAKVAETVAAAAQATAELAAGTPNGA